MKSFRDHLALRLVKAGLAPNLIFEVFRDATIAHGEEVKAYRENSAEAPIIAAKDGMRVGRNIVWRSEVKKPLHNGDDYNRSINAVKVVS